MGRLSLLVTALLFSSTVFARASISCIFLSVDNQWAGGAIYSYNETPDPTAGRIVWQITPGGLTMESPDLPAYGVCAATTDADISGVAANVNLATYVRDDDTESMSPATCQWEGAKPGKTLGQSTVTVLPGDFAEVDSDSADPTPPSKILNYVPTDAELTQWQAMTEDDASPVINKRCLDLVPGSIPIQSGRSWQNRIFKIRPPSHH